MKHSHIFIPAILLCIFLSGCAPKTQNIPAIITAHKDRATFTKVNDGSAQLVPLFNGTDLSGWYTFTQTYGKDNDVEKAFTVTDGALHLAGEAMGYLCTNNAYKNYYLHVVFRWGEKKYAPRENHPRDSGVLYHFSGTSDDNVWPTSIECQVQENDCGDYYCVNGASLESPNASPEGQSYRVVRTANFEKPNPEWNTIEIICLDDRSEHYVNGQLVNEAYNLSTTEGKILLQLEGAEIIYKTVELLPLK
jgi:hypothetical protein